MNDLKFAFRQLLKNPGFTGVAVLTLALGIGTNIAIFSFVEAVLLKSLPVKQPEQLMTVGTIVPSQPGPLTHPSRTPLSEKCVRKIWSSQACLRAPAGQ